MTEDRAPHTDPFTPADAQRHRAERTYTALFRIEERHAATPDARSRQGATQTITPQEAVRLVTMLAAGSIPVDEDEPAVDRADLIAALTLVPLVRAEIDALELSLIQVARGRGMAWSEIAFGLGLRSAQAAQQRSDRLARRSDEDSAT